MPRYEYEKLRVACLDPVDFAPNEIRQAVECLKGKEQGKFIWLQAETSTTVGKYKLRAMVVLTLDEITGKTPREVWNRFDELVDEQRASLAKRG